MSGGKNSVDMFSIFGSNCLPQALMNHLKYRFNPPRNPVPVGSSLSGIYPCKLRLACCRTIAKPTASEEFPNDSRGGTKALIPFAEAANGFFYCQSQIHHHKNMMEDKTGTFVRDLFWRICSIAVLSGYRMTAG